MQEMGASLTFTYVYGVYGMFDIMFVSLGVQNIPLEKQ